MYFLERNVPFHGMGSRSRPCFKELDLDIVLEILKSSLEICWVREFLKKYKELKDSMI